MINENINLRLGLNKFINPTINGNLIGVFDTSISSLNVGDEIINASAMEFLENIFAQNQFLKFSTHAGISSIGIYRANLCKLRVVCGSNLLSGSLFKTGQWNLSPLDVLRIKKHVLMGVGWLNYNSKLSVFTKLAYRSLLSKENTHSVRDEYTKLKLAEMGITNVINTGCPTMWKLTSSHCASIPKKKSNKVVFTLTDYSKDEIVDKYLIKTLLSNYERVYFWIQGSGDLEYFNSLGFVNSGIQVIPPQLSKYDYVLQNENIDFIGTRLHAGIRALQNKRKTLIISVDNRATEKAKDFNLPVIERILLKDSLQKHIDEDYECKININENAINDWISQFK